MPLSARVTTDGIVPTITTPSADELISGAPVFTTWEVEARPGISAGLWQSTPGQFRLDYKVWEYVHIHSGHVIVHS